MQTWQVYLTVSAGEAVWEVHRHRVAPEIHEAPTWHGMDGTASMEVSEEQGCSWVSNAQVPAGKAIWDVHRHRVAPEIHQALTQYFMEGNARVQSAHLVGLRTAPGGGVLAKLDVGKGQEAREEEFDFVVNCTGPNNCESSLWASPCVHHCSFLEILLKDVQQKARRGGGGLPPSQSGASFAIVTRLLLEGNCPF